MVLLINCEYIWYRRHAIWYKILIAVIGLWQYIYVIFQEVLRPQVCGSTQVVVYNILHVGWVPSCNINPLSNFSWSLVVFFDPLLGFMQYVGRKRYGLVLKVFGIWEIVWGNMWYSGYISHEYGIVTSGINARGRLENEIYSPSHILWAKGRRLLTWRYVR